MGITSEDEAKTKLGNAYVAWGTCDNLY